MYTGEIREALTGAIDTTKLAEAWQALHPKDVSKGAPPGRPSQGGGQEFAEVPGQLARISPTRLHAPAGAADATKAISPLLSQFLGRASTAITGALKRVLTRLWTEAWVLGNRSATALTDGGEVDWGAWTPGDHRAAEAIAGDGLRLLLADADIRIKSISDNRLEELAAVLEQTLASDSVHRQPLPAPLEPSLSVGDLARQLRDVLDMPSRAELVAHTEIARAQAEASRQVYAATGRAEVEISTAEDDKVCPVCEAAQAAGAHPLYTDPQVPLHPRCRCAELPVLEPA